MPRSLRSYQAGNCLHIVQRGDNRRPCFADDIDRQHYLDLLAEHSEKTGCNVHAYALMPNHVHLLLTINERNAQSWLMKSIAQFAAHWMHQRYGTSGTMWEGRYHASEIDSEAYLLLCQRYIELNPVRAGIVAFPGHFRWSSYRTNAEGREEDWLVPHPVYRGLGLDRLSREAAYRALFDTPFAETDLMRIRFAIGNDFAMRNPGKPGSDPRV
ncbi:transposase [Pseudoduganella sp.]|uniref:transposase n=1 Tax=Pseudoduganella sp. TaxID=1880898 RepID=UPI0035AEF052